MRALDRARDSTLGLRATGARGSSLQHTPSLPTLRRTPPAGDEKTPVGKINIGTILMICARRLFQQLF